MGREKKAAPGAASGSHAKDRHKKKAVADREWSRPLPAGLDPRRAAPQIKSKHQSYFELVENKDKKKKLEFKITADQNPPPGFEFVPIGNPKLTSACKEISREQDAMIFIVSVCSPARRRKARARNSHKLQPQASTKTNNQLLSHHLNRTGHHIRQTIVEQARAAIGDDPDTVNHQAGVPEPIPETQDEINKQADQAIRDLFPRIPNTDRQMIIEHAFKKGATMNGDPLVGLAKDITLSRRVQLAVLAHIRHNHTRYDDLLRETTYVNARKAVEPLCLDIIVKWRGDEETGRDQLEEILREVIVLSDSEDEDDSGDDDETDDTAISSDSIQEITASTTAAERDALQRTLRHSRPRMERLDKQPRGTLTRPLPRASALVPLDLIAREERRAAKKAQRGFKRYEAVRQARWDEARTRFHLEEGPGRNDQAHAAQRHDMHLPEPGTSYRPEMMHSLGTDSTSSVQSARILRAASLGHSHLPSPFRRSGRGEDQPMHAYHTTSEARVPYASLDGQMASTSLAQSRQSSRLTVGPEDLQDYLVPSIEPASPVANNDNATPVFVRRVSPTESFVQNRRPAAGHAHNASPLHRTPGFDRPLAYPPDGREQPEYIRTSSGITYHPALPRERHASGVVHQGQESPRFMGSRESPGGRSYVRDGATASRPILIDGNAETLRETPHRPIVVDDWPDRHSRVRVLQPPPHQSLHTFTRGNDVDVHRATRLLPAESIFVAREAPLASSLREVARSELDRPPVEFITLNSTSRTAEALDPNQIYRRSPRLLQERVVSRVESVGAPQPPREYEKYGSPMMLDPPREARPASVGGAYFDPALRPRSPALREVRYDERGRVLIPVDSQPPPNQPLPAPAHHPGPSRTRRHDGVYGFERDPPYQY
ncbi:uncharacterized protein E0L32_010429 [Thyridium curvatum]|uniref:DUF2293 domain-containing protein n=1 Tax=Thyridium curvatum TaxID=1093900 RepID=A0A507ANF7_9PEZI|nr:uncharacterized protein E0L32_010429 [Thyridium curvatum]TPX07854.1 hypothetical protein E0L32_010429 [Thyridium curvatum]